jgi:glycosyltransferase involved in cell wall biosynthesis
MNIMSDTSYPLVSIGVPVFNGEKTLEDAIECLLKQDYSNLEIIISDNASTDATQNICEKYSRNESRIKYFRTEENLGAIWNFNHVFELSTGKYFMWAAHDDLRESSFVSSCVDKLEQHPDAVLCQAHTGNYIEGNDEVLYVANLDSFDNEISLSERYRETLKCFPATAIYGVYRSSAVRKTHLYENCIATDLAFIQELSMYGRFVQVPRLLFKYFGRKKWNTVNQDYYVFFGNKNKPWWYLPFVALFLNHWNRIASSKNSVRTKLLLWAVLFNHEASRIVFRAMIKFIGLICPNDIKEALGREIYMRWMHNPNIKIANTDLYMERVIKPVLRWWA